MMFSFEGADPWEVSHDTSLLDNGLAMLGLQFEAATQG